MLCSFIIFLNCWTKSLVRYHSLLWCRRNTKYRFFIQNSKHLIKSTLFVIENVWCTFDFEKKFKKSFERSMVLIKTIFYINNCYSVSGFWQCECFIRSCLFRVRMSHLTNNKKPPSNFKYTCYRQQIFYFWTT